MLIRRAVLASAFSFFATTANAQSRADIAAAYGGTIPPQCVSSHVDLGQLAQCECAIRPQPRLMNGQTVINARMTCGDAIERQAIGRLVDLGVSVRPSPIGGGAPMTVVISIKNTSSAPVPVVIHEDAPWLRNLLSVRNASGAEVARADMCGEGMSAGLEAALVVLPPAGVAEWRLPWRAATRATDAKCLVTWRPLPAGTYALSVPLQLPQIPNAIARGTMIVQ